MKKYLLYYEVCKKQKHQIFLGYFLLIMEAALVAGLPFLMNRVFDLLFSISRENYIDFVLLFSIYALLMCLQFLLSYSSTILFKIVGNKNTEKIGSIIAEKIYYSRKKSPAQFDVGNILQALSADIHVVGESGITIVYDILHTSISIMSLFVFMLYVDWILTLILVIGFITLMLLQQKANKKAENYIIMSRASAGKYEYIVNKFATQYHDYRAINCYKYFVKTYIDSIKHLIKDKFHVTKLFAGSGMLFGAWTTINMIIVLLFGARGVIVGSITIGALITFNMYSNNVGSYIMRIPGIISQYKEFAVSYDRLLKLYNSEQFFEETLSFKNKIQSINVCKATFSFSKKFIINNINICFRKGTLYCLSGINGSGKTTLINILMGEYDLQHGYISWNDLPIVPQKDRMKLNQEISYLSSNIVLFNDTLINNITLGCEYDRHKLNEVISVLNMQDFALDSVMDEMQEHYSAGQLQKIALARCLLSDKNIIILDEFERHLDDLTQKNVITYLQRIKEDRIIILISHDANTKKNCDIILQMKDGELYEK